MHEIVHLNNLLFVNQDVDMPTFQDFQEMQHSYGGNGNGTLTLLTFIHVTSNAKFYHAENNMYPPAVSYRLELGY